MFNNKKIGLIIPVKYNSERLPGKILCNINGKLQIERIIERALQSQYIDQIILAIINENNESEKILEWYNNSKYNIEGFRKIDYFIGEYNNIIKRCLNAAEYFNIDIIVDVSQDCTFFDPCLVNRLIERLFIYDADYSTNCITRTFPNGFDIQVYTKEIYKRIYESNEYFWRYSGWNIFYAREKIYPKPKIINLEADILNYFPHWHLCLDTNEDKILIEKIFKHFENYENNLYPHYYEIIYYLKKNKKLLKINENIIDTELLKEKN